MQQSLEKLQTLFQGRHRENISLHGEVISWGGGGDIRTNFILKGLLSYLRCLVIKVHLYQSIPVYFAVEVKTDIQINFSNIKLENSTYFYKIKKDICLYRPLPMFCKDPQASRSATKSQPPSRAILPPPITSYMHS